MKKERSVWIFRDKDTLARMIDESKTLTDKERLFLHTKLVKDLTLRAAGEELGCWPETVRLKVAKGFEKLWQERLRHELWATICRSESGTAYKIILNTPNKKIETGFIYPDEMFKNKKQALAELKKYAHINLSAFKQYGKMASEVTPEDMEKELPVFNHYPIQIAL